MVEMSILPKLIHRYNILIISIKMLTRFFVQTRIFYNVYGKEIRRAEIILI